MSLLMEALRRAQQVQEETAGTGKKEVSPPPAAMAAEEEVAPIPVVLESWPVKEQTEETLELEPIEDEPLHQGTGQEDAGGSGEQLPSAGKPDTAGIGGTASRDPLDPAPAGSVASGSRRDDAFGGSLEASRQAAQAMFLAKKRQKQQHRRKRMLLIAMLALLGIGAAGGFLLLSSRDIWQHGQPIAQTRPQPPPVAPTEAETGQENSALAAQPVPADGEISPPSFFGEPAAAIAETASAELQSGEEANTLPPPAVPPAAESATVLPANEMAEPPLPSLPVTSTTADESADPIRYEPEPLTLPQAPPAIRITRQTLAPQSDLRLGRANSAFLQGRTEQARSLYQQITNETPGHRGALFGLAALAVQEGDIGLAQQHYLDLLEQDPADPRARAGLISIIPKTDLLQLESELKRLLTIHPDLAPLSFLLGNLYATGQRWAEAQQAYFQALEAISRHHTLKDDALAPDYPFNLAVSLEHLSQPDLAVRYYRQALQLADSHPAGFDREVVRQRLAELEQGGER